MRKKIFVIFLSMLMAVALLATPAMAEEYTANALNYARVMANAQDGDTVTYTGAILLLNGNNTIKPGVPLVVSGLLNVTGQFVNNGTVDVKGSATFASFSTNNGTINVENIMNNSGDFRNTATGVVNANGNFINFGFTNNDGEFNVGGNAILIGPVRGTLNN
jgi:hypothetical protein